MFGEMRKALSISKEIDILDHVYSLPTPEDRENAMVSDWGTPDTCHNAQLTFQESIREIERRAMSKQQAQPGVVELMSYIDSKSLPKGICTRNFDMPVDHLITRFLSAVKPFHPSEYCLPFSRKFKPLLQAADTDQSSRASFDHLSPTRPESCTSRARGGLRGPAAPGAAARVS
jgi:hypothetical protein